MFLQLSLERDGAESIQGGEVKTKQIKTRVEVTEELWIDQFVPVLGFL